MPVTSLIQQLAQHDIRLWLEQEQLRYSAPEGAMTTEMMQQLRHHKTAIIDFLKQNEASAEYAIGLADRQKPLVVSSAQQRLWFIQQLDPLSSALHIHSALEVKGELDISLLEQACRQIIQRHAILRTSYYQQAGKLYQRIHESVDWQLKQQTIEASQLKHALATSLHQSFDLQQPPLLRCEVFCLQAQHYVVSFCVHHIAADGWSLGIFVAELMTIYQALTQHQTPQLAPLSRQYADFAAWQTSPARQTQLKTQLDYWQKQLSGVPDLNLPARAQPDAQSKAAYVQREMPIQAIQQFNQQHNSTLFITLMALFSSLLYRYSQQKDFCLGTPVAGRDASVLEPLIGCFINVLAIRCEPGAELSFIDYWRTIKATCQAALENQHVPFEQVVQALNLTRDIQQTPLFHTMLSVQNTPFQAGQLDGLNIRALDSDEASAQFCLKLTAQEQGQSLQLRFEYQQKVFDARFIERMADHFVRLCQSACQAPETRLADLDYFTAQQVQPLKGPNQALDLPFLPQQIAYYAEHSADAIAVSDGQQSLTYQAFNQQANQLAHYLIEQGAQGHIIAVCLERSHRLMISLVAILKAGAAYLPIDPSLPKQRIEYMLSDSAALLCLSQSELSPLLPDHCVLLDQLDVSAYGLGNPELAINGEDLAYLLYTSGSTGQPKGVMIEHHSLLNYLQFASQHYMTDVDASVVSSTISFDATITTLFTPFLSGKTVKLCADNDDDFHQLTAYISQSQQAYLFKITPAHLSLLGHRLSAFSSTAGHVFVVGGEQLLSQTVQQWLTITPNARFVNEYGPTETVVGCCQLSVDANNIGQYQSLAAIPIGQAIDNTQLLVLDAEQNSLPDGLVGELYIAGAGLARGYLNLAEKTQLCFIEKNQQRLYKTGDWVRLLDDGNLLYCGRADSQVKLRGQRLELEAIEALMQAFSGVQMAAANVVYHQGDARLLAWYQAKETLDETALKAYLAERLPAYMVPSALIAVEQWPLSPSGKINRNKLPQPDWNRFNRAPFVAPQSDTEKQLAHIWQTVLGVEQIGIDDDFFTIGGHSLTAAEALALAQQQFAVELPLRKLFETPTIKAIAALLDAALLEKRILAEHTQDEEESESFIL